jgi:hypothetical protein
MKTDPKSIGSTVPNPAEPGGNLSVSVKPTDVPNPDDC